MKYDLKSIMLRAWKNYRKYKELSLLNACTEHGSLQKRKVSILNVLRERKRQQVLRKLQKHGVNGRKQVMR